MKIFFNDFKKEYQSEKKDINKAMMRVAASGWYILGEEVRKFEKDFAKFIGTKHAIGVANGLEALQVILLALGIKKGDEVITTSLSAAATALAITSVGAKPVFVDIDDFYHIDSAKLANKITDKTFAIIPVHLYGQPAEMDKILAIAKKHKIYVVEDCAQSHGAKFKNKTTGSMGVAGAFSFYPTKNLGALGDAGAITMSDNSLAEKCRSIRNYGQKNRYEHETFGINSRLDELQAAILDVKLKKLANANKKRNTIANLYRKYLKGVREIKLPEERMGTTHAYHLFVIEAEKRDELQNFLKEKGIPTLIHYPIPIHKQKSFKEFNSQALPETEKKVKQILSLPCHPYLSGKEVKFVADNIKLFYISSR